MPSFVLRALHTLISLFLTWALLSSCSIDYEVYKTLPADQALMKERFERKFSNPNELTPSCELAGFLAYWLSAVMLPSSKSADGVRVSCFVVAGALANGRQFSLAPPVLCSLYRAFGNIASNKDQPWRGMNVAYCPWHFFCGWLGIYFPWTYGVDLFQYFHTDHAPLYRYRKLNMITRSSDWIASKIGNWAEICFYHFPVSDAGEDREVVDNEHSVDVTGREFLVSIRTASLPLREGIEFWREPYYPSRFARQFGYDQGVPMTLPDVTKVERAYGTGPVHWEWIWHQLLMTRTGARFMLPGLYRKTSGSYSWLRWWVHQYALVRNNSSVDDPLYIPPPGLTEVFADGLGYYREQAEAYLSSSIKHKISLSVSIDHRKEDTALDGWHTFGIPLAKWSQEAGFTRLLVIGGDKDAGRLISDDDPTMIGPTKVISDHASMREQAEPIGEDNLQGSTTPGNNTTVSIAPGASSVEGMAESPAVTEIIDTDSDTTELLDVTSTPLTETIKPFPDATIHTATSSEPVFNPSFGIVLS
jgi:hypothetical protein